MTSCFRRSGSTWSCLLRSFPDTKANELFARNAVKASIFVAKSSSAPRPSAAAAPAKDTTNLLSSLSIATARFIPNPGAWVLEKLYLPNTRKRIKIDHYFQLNWYILLAIAVAPCRSSCVRIHANQSQSNPYKRAALNQALALVRHTRSLLRAPAGSVSVHR